MCVRLNKKDTFCLYNFIKILSSFTCLGFRLELVDEFTKIVPTAFGPFIGPHQGLLACIKIVFERVFERVFFRLFIILQNYLNADLDETEMLRNLKNSTLPRKIEYY